MKKCIFLLFWCNLVVTAAISQQQNRDQTTDQPTVTNADGSVRRAGEILLRLAPDETVEHLAQNLTRRSGGIITFWPLTTHAAAWRIAKIGFDESAVANPDAVLVLVQQAPGVEVAQWNHRAEERTRTPNDPDWLRQDNLRLIGASEAWDISTGGVSASGDTIVVGILELGMNRSHPDLVPNLWVNRAEIPGNKTDDDRNGYVDDYLGWDARKQGDGSGTGSSHGTSVNGIIGAKGNNNVGVSGVNWNVKMMTVTNTEYEDEIVGAYYYMVSWRQRYNRSNGKDGAFVVATNASIGLDRQRANNYPLWCAVYDTLGKAGILSVGATANRGVDVEVEGDMPTTCTSEFLVTVTNVFVSTDIKVPGAGYGSKSIDMGAPGDGTYSTTNQTSSGLYGRFGGTSASAPHVTGSIALLHSLNCKALTEDALTNPPAAARRVRDILLRNVAPNSTLQRITTTGGRLDLARSVEAVQDLCKGADRGYLDILQLKPNPVQDQLRLRFQTPTVGDPYTLRIFNMLGQLMYAETINTDGFRVTEAEITTSNWPLGVYVVSFGQGKAVVSKKFLKK